LARCLSCASYVVEFEDDFDSKMYVDFTTRRRDVIDYAVLLTVAQGGECQTVRLYDAAHGVDGSTCPRPLGNSWETLDFVRSLCYAKNRRVCRTFEMPEEGLESRHADYGSSRGVLWDVARSARLALLLGIRL
jgi:hypothetical protein